MVSFNLLSKRTKTEFAHFELEPGLLCSLFLGLSDLAVETVFRTVDGFVTPWVGWSSSEPNGHAGLPAEREDCVGRSPSGAWADFDFSRNYRFYCEGTEWIVS